MLTSPDHAKKIWKFILPHLKTDIRNDMIALNYCDNVKKCAEMMGDKAIAAAVKLNYEKIMAEIEEMHEED